MELLTGQPDGGNGPLTGIDVLDLGQIYNAPYATLLMALAGARVIKVEPRLGENLRSRGRVPGAGAPFAMLNSNKLGITVDLKQPEGRELLETLAGKVDVLVENFRPGVMDRLGLSAETLRGRYPRLIYASGSGYGSTGPYRDYPAMDLTIQAISGAMAVTGFPDRDPVKAGPALGDFLGGIHLYGAIVTALYQRERTGAGATVEVAMLDAVYPSLTSSLGLYFSGSGASPTRTGNRHSGLAESPYNVFPAKDGHVALFCVTDQHWSSLIDVMERPELRTRADLATRAGRVEAIDEVDDIVAAWTRTYQRDEVVRRLLDGGVPAAPVREVSEVVADGHLRSRGMLVDIDHPEHGPMTVPHSPLRVGSYRADIVASPALGADNRLVLKEWLGLTDCDIDRLIERGVL